MTTRIEPPQVDSDETTSTGSPAETITVLALLMMIGVVLGIGGLRYGFGSFAAPGSGFLAVLVGGVMVVIGTVLLVKELRARGGGATDGRPSEPEHELVGATASPRPSSRLNGPLSLLVVTGAFAFVIVATEALGLLVTAAVIASVLAFLMNTRWWSALLVGVGFYLVGYLVFAVWLAIPLPFGTITGG